MAGIQRRQFLKVAGIGAGATALACAGLGYLATRAPVGDAVFYEHTGEEMEKTKGKVLIAYASKLGSTGEVSQAIGEELTAGGHAVDVKRISGAMDVSAYRSILLGSAVRRGRWLPEAFEFLEKNSDSLAQKSVSFFTVCMTVYQDTAENRARAQKITGAAHALREPAAEAFFGGRMDYGKLSLAEQMILRAMKIPEGDYRDWEAIRTWAKNLPAG